MEGAQAVESLGTNVKVRKDWKAVVGEMAQVGRQRRLRLTNVRNCWERSQGGKSPILEEGEQQLPHSGG